MMGAGLGGGPQSSSDVKRGEWECVMGNERAQCNAMLDEKERVSGEIGAAG